MTRADGDLTGRLSQLWELLLPGLASEASLPYFRQFLPREAMRHARATVPHNAATVEPEVS